MAVQIDLGSFSLLSSGDMSAKQYLAVKASTANAVDGAVLLAVRGAGPITGVWQDNSTQTEAGKVQFLGITKLAAGDSSAMANAIAVGAPVVASSVGQGVPSTAAGQGVIGIALDALSTGSTGVISVLMTPGAIST